MHELDLYKNCRFQINVSRAEGISDLYKNHILQFCHARILQHIRVYGTQFRDLTSD